MKPVFNNPGAIHNFSLGQQVKVPAEIYGWIVGITADVDGEIFYTVQDHAGNRYDYDAKLVFEDRD